MSRVQVHLLTYVSRDLCVVFSSGRPRCRAKEIHCIQLDNGQRGGGRVAVHGRQKMQEIEKIPIQHHACWHR